MNANTRQILTDMLRNRLWWLATTIYALFAAALMFVVLSTGQ